MKPKFQNSETVYKLGGDNKDIRDLLESLVPRAKAQMKDMAQRFKGRNERETCKRIFDYIKANFSYVADREEQTIKLPSALLEKRVGDCKSYALFTAAILENLKIPYSLIYTSYTSNPIPGHVYVVTDGGCIIDAVYGVFNREKPSTFKYTKKMNVKYISGIPGSIPVGKCGPGYSGISGAGTGIGGGGVKRVVLAPGRGLFLGIVKANLDGIANKLQNVSTSKLKATWENAGGKYENLVEAIKRGASKPAKKIGLLGLIRRKLKKTGANGTGVGASEDNIKAAIVGASSAIGTAIAPGAGTAAGASIGAVLVALIPIVIDLVNQTPASDETESVQTAPIQAEPDPGATPGATPGTTPGATQTGTQFDFSRALPFVIGAAGLYLLTKRKGK
jgi:hypothetical protein